MHQAAQQGHVNIIDFLLQQNASPNAVTNVRRKITLHILHETIYRVKFKQQISQIGPEIRKQVGD